MIVCVRCGTSSQPTSKFCAACGNPLAPPSPPNAPAPPAAGQPLPGQPYGPQPAPAAPPAWGGGGYGGGPAPQPAAPQPAPPPAPGGWGPPPGGGFAPAPPDPYGAPERARYGSPEGLNPFGATVGSPVVQPGGPPPGAPPPGYAGYPPPPQPAPWSPAPHAQPTPPPAAGYSHDPVAFAATAPPPVGAEYDVRDPSQPPPAYRGFGQGAAAPAPQHQPPQHQPPQQQPPQNQRPPSVPPPAQRAGVGVGVDPEHIEPSAPRALAGFLVTFEGNETGVFWPLYQGQNVVGRRGAAAGLDIEIDHPTTSSRHAIILAAARPGRIKIEDPGSTNGTFLREQQLERAKKYELKDGDTLRFGGFPVIVKIV